MASESPTRAAVCRGVRPSQSVRWTEVPRERSSRTVSVCSRKAARWRADSPEEKGISLSAPASRSIWTAEISPAATAQCSGVLDWLSLALTSALRASSSISSCRFPAIAAKWRGVRRSRSQISMGTPASRYDSTLSVLPRPASRWMSAACCCRWNDSSEAVAARAASHCRPGMGLWRGERVSCMDLCWREAFPRCDASNSGGLISSLIKQLTWGAATSAGLTACQVCVAEV
mmetsp:Transcript_15131/g.42397  ORF Transcript_15131/g.42397 Transcript_15131/m.42397 type:complete len:231 (-) Transcript_15131:221-913(-)